jgi:uncharacterized membrane protein YgdD (TMEM256/DUF423 family)
MKEKSMNPAFWLRVGAIWGFLAISMGAFGAHLLDERFRDLAEKTAGTTAERLKDNFHTAAQYHMYCALALLAVGVLAETGRGSTALEAAGWSLLLGSLVFSGSLYVLAVTGLKWLGAITPIGGVVMLIGWLALALAAGTGKE